MEFNSEFKGLTLVKMTVACFAGKEVS